MAALSHALPDRHIEQTTPLSAISYWKCSLTYWADSSGRRNTQREDVAMDNRKNRSARSVREPLGSPGHPPVAGRQSICRHRPALRLVC
jgi:hypothetical protein